MNKLEEIFDRNASQRMKLWNYKSFKRDYPTLTESILSSLEEVNNQNKKTNGKSR